MARVVCPEVPHHITQRGGQQSNIFLDEADHRRYLELLACYAPKFGLEITSYCVMTNHVHIVGVPEREDSIGKVFRDCHGIYAAEFNKKYGKTGHVWQARPYSCVLDEAHTWAAIRYVEPSVPSPAANYVQPCALETIFTWPVKAFMFRAKSGGNSRKSRRTNLRATLA